MLINYTETDIDRNLAHRAFYNTSHTPERRGDLVIREYIRHMAAVDEEFSVFITDKNRDELTNDLEYYRQKYVQLLTAYLQSHSNVVSSFIAGPANFPIRRNQKRSQWADNHRDRWLDWSKKQLENLRRKYDPRLLARAPISSDDPEAIAKLQGKIDKARAMQEMMKAANKIIRSKKTREDKETALSKLGLGQTVINEILTPDYMGQVGFPSFRLTNNNANIRRMEQRLKQLQESRNDASQTIQVDEVEIKDNVEANRVQIFFPGKPAYEIRQQLKSRGFRWTPSVGAWQRHRSEEALRLAREIVECQSELD